MNQARDPEAVVGRRRSQGWVRVSRGLYRTHDCNDLAAWQLVLPPCGAFTHLTAARALGWWVPPLPAGLPVIARVDRRTPRPRRPGLQVIRSDPRHPPAEHESLRLDSACDVLLVSARDLALLDLLVLVDSALHAGACTRLDIEVVAACGRRGTRRLREALHLADGRAESPWETLLRAFHVVCEVDVEPQPDIVMPDGSFVARADLLLSGTRTIHEYDGGDHLRRDQQQADLRRARRLNDAGVVRRGYTSYDLLREPIGILRDIDATMGRDHDPSRLRAWHALLFESLHTRSGQARLMARLAQGRAPTDR